MHLEEYVLQLWILVHPNSVSCKYNGNYESQFGKLNFFYAERFVWWKGERKTLLTTSMAEHHTEEPPRPTAVRATMLHKSSNSTEK